MPRLFDDFDLDLRKVNMSVSPRSDSGGDSINECGGGGSLIGSLTCNSNCVCATQYCQTYFNTCASCDAQCQSLEGRC